MTLIEVIVACSLLAIVFTSLTGISVKLAARNRRNASEDQRTAVMLSQLNRAEAMPYDSLSYYLVKDSVLAGGSYVVWDYAVDAESLSVSNRARYRKITLTVTPRSDAAAVQSLTIRRDKTPFSNPLNK
jgi:hypothetical protein